MNLLIYGVTHKATEALFHSAAALFGIDVAAEAVSPPHRPPAHLRTDWDLLAFGPALFDTSLPALIEQLSLEHPTGLILAIGSETDTSLAEACLKAGALQVLSAKPSRVEVELAVGRAATLLHRFERQIHEEKLQGISQLAVSVNHEVNNPLMGLMGTAELILMENENLPEKVRRDLRTVIDQARRIQSITLRLRDLNHLRTVPYDERASMIDLFAAGESQPETPAPSPPLQPEAPRESAAVTPLPAEVFGAPRIMIVDDNQLIIDLLHRLLDERFEIDHATRPSAALQKIRRQEYELILLDLILPEMDGLELFRAIRQIRHDQRVVLTTGYDSDPRVRLALEEGALNWIQKPFKFEALEEMLQSALKTGDAVGR